MSLVACNHGGLDPAVPAEPGEVRAGIVREGVEGEAALFGGINAEGRAGDVKIYNDRVQFIVQGPYRSHGLVDVGGGVIDADLVRSDGSLGRDTLEDLFLGFGLARLFDGTTLEILSDGSDGDAVVQVTGRDERWDYLMGLLERDDDVPLGLQITHTYTLPADAWSLRVESVLTNSGEQPVDFVLSDGLLASGEDQVPWSPGGGFAASATGLVDTVILTGRQGEATLALWPEEGTYTQSPLGALAGDLGVLLPERPAQTLAPGESVTFVKYLTVAPDTATAEAERHTTQGRSLGQVSGTVQADAPVAGARVHFVDEDGVAAIAMTDRQGHYSARLAQGDYTAYVVGHDLSEYVQSAEGAGRYGPFTAASVNDRQLQVLSGQAVPALPYAQGYPSPEGTALTVSLDTTLDLALPAASALVVTVSSAGAALPAVLEVRHLDPVASAVPEALRAALGVSTSTRAAWAWTSTGSATVPLLPGRYSVRAGNSWRYAQQIVEVVVAEGQTASVDLELEEVVPRDGWLSLDPHLHAAPSFDGALPMEDRLITCAAAGVDLPVLTDHDAMVDYSPLARALGLSWMQVIPGLEVTSLFRGHFNLYPVSPDPLNLVNGGAEPWWHIPADTQELFDRMQVSGGPDALIQVNHPRGPGMFGIGNFDPKVGDSDRPTHFSWDFDTFELLNGGAEGFEDVREDWFSLLDWGRGKVPTGASDSHYRYIPCGLSHTDVYLDADDPADITVAEVRQALLDGHVVVASGLTLRASIGEALPGDTVVGSEVTLEVSVAAPDWVVPGTLRVYRGGEVVFEQVLPQTVTTPVTATVPVQAQTDTWLVVEVEGEQPQGALWRDALPYAAANAFFIDVQGDGWTPPRH